MSSPTSPGAVPEPRAQRPYLRAGNGDPSRPDVLAFGPFTFDTRSRLLSRNGEELALPPRVIGVLELLLTRAGEVVPRQDLIETVWKDAFVTDTSLAEAISVLRQALGDEPQSPTYIQTLHRRGYRFVAPVEPRGSARTAQSQPEPDVAEVRVSPSIGKELIPWSAAAILFVIAMAAVWQATRGRDAIPSAARFTIAPAAGTAVDANAPGIALSDDGQQLAWSGCDAGICRLYLRPVNDLVATPLAGTEAGHTPFFSPDGRWIAFFADGRLKKIATAGGAPITLADAPAMHGGAWHGDEIIYAGAASGGLMRVPANGGEPRRLTKPRERDGEVRHAWPSIVPGTNVLLFTVAIGHSDAPAGILAALSLDAAGPAEARDWRLISEGVDLARAPSADAIVFSRGAELYALRFDAARLAAAGAPRAVLSAVATAGGRAHFAVSPSGALAYVTPPAADREVGWMASTTPIKDEIRRLRDAALAPDGSRIAGVVVEGARSNVWVVDAARGAATRLTHTGINASPIWSADARALYYATKGAAAFELWRRDADGTRPAERMLQTGQHAIPVAASPDGALLAFTQTADGTGMDIWAIATSGGEARRLVGGPFDEIAGSFSPDSRLLAFQSSETGRWEIYVQRLADGRRTVVSSDGGERPIWTSAGLHYQSGRSLMRATVMDDERLSVGAVTKVADLGRASLRGVAMDGALLVEHGPDLSRAHLVLATDWRRDLGTLLGPPAAALPR